MWPRGDEVAGWSKVVEDDRGGGWGVGWWRCKAEQGRGWRQGKPCWEDAPEWPLGRARQWKTLEGGGRVGRRHGRAVAMG